MVGAGGEGVSAQAVTAKAARAAKIVFTIRMLQLPHVQLGDLA
jgi:hypothetical protein